MVAFDAYAAKAANEASDEEVAEYNRRYNPETAVTKASGWDAVPASRAKFFGLGTTDPSTGPSAAGAAPVITVASAGTPLDISLGTIDDASDYKVEFYFGLYIEGQTAANTDGVDLASATPNGNFEIIVGDPTLVS